jgi:hypothetical protein
LTEKGLFVVILAEGGGFKLTEILSEIDFRIKRFIRIGQNF